MKQTIYIAGGSGLIGRELAASLADSGYTVYKIARIPYGAPNTYCWEEVMHNGFTSESDYSIINLAGDNISSGRWTKRKKEKILSSRLNVIDNLSVAIKKSKNKPILFLQGSAIGYYDQGSDHPSDENAQPGHSFLSQVVKQVEEHAADKVGKYTKVISLRTGIVWARQGGAFPSLIQPFRYSLGGKIGSGRQWHSWIHLKDEARAIRFLLENPADYTIYNLTAPNPIQNKDFAQMISKAMNRPSWFPLPGFILKIVFGEKAKAIMLQGERVQPKRLMEEGFTFEFEQAEHAIADLLL
ncbi:TIGR01777 family oxidoreductase [Bacteroidota bacterium]